MADLATRPHPALTGAALLLCVSRSGLLRGNCPFKLDGEVTRVVLGIPVSYSRTVNPEVVEKDSTPGDLVGLVEVPVILLNGPL